MGFRLSGRDNARSFRSQGVCDVQQPVAHHAEQAKTFFGVVMPRINPLDSKARYIAIA
jgi:hypothetical protein